MHFTRAILFLLLLFPLQQVHAQQGADLRLKLDRLLDVIYDNHIQPREIEAGFIEDVNRSFFESVDGLEIIFSSEDQQRIEDLSVNLQNGIRINGSAFVDSSFVIWNNGLARASSLYENRIQESIYPDAGADSTFFLSRVSKNELENKWKALLHMKIISEAVSLASDDESLANNYSKSLDSARLIIKQEFDDYFTILKEYRQEFEESFLRALAESFDPHTTYFSTAGYDDFKEELSGERELFGINYARNTKGQLTIANVMPGSSAWISGEVHSGDLLIEIDFGSGNSFALQSKTPFELGKLFEEHGEDEITLTLKTGDDNEREVTLYKSKVYSDSDVIKSAVLKGEKAIGYISLPDFYTNWESEDAMGCANDVAKAILKLKKQSVEGIILDLRDNGGGSLKEAVDLAGIFLNFGPVLVADDGGEKPYTIKDMNRGLIFSGPLVIMVNEYSASASEVLAAALQDHNRAVIVGGQTYGKATGQSFVPLTYETDLEYMDDSDIFGYAKVTRSALYRINLETNQARGVIPDVELPISKEREGAHEEDYPTVLQFDSISKKMYFTPLAELPTNDVRAASAIRVNTDEVWNQIITLQKEAEKLSDAFDPFTATMDEWMRLNASIADIEEQQGILIDEYSVSFNAESLQFDSEVFEMDSVLKMYNDRFLERLASDIDLNETYLIINQLTEK